MGRIPETELERLKQEVDLAALVRSKGIELKKHGSKDLAGLSPFSDEKTPSFIVTPGKNLWHCMSSGQGGSVIDFLMKHDGVSFRHAVLLLKEQNPQLFGLRKGSERSGALSKATVPKLEAPVKFTAEDEELFNQTLSYYEERLWENPSAIDYLKKRGIYDEAAINHFGIGYADRTLGLRLPHKNRKDGELIRERLMKLGLYRKSGHEHFNGCLVFPIRDEKGSVSEIYGRKANEKQKNGIYHLYLPGPHRGIWNRECLKSPEIILCESVIDALSFWVHGFKNVTCIYGTEGFTDEYETLLKKNQPQKVYLAYDRDKAGERAVERDAKRLGKLGIDCYRLKLPANYDVNEYALRVTPANKSLQVLLQSAEWIDSKIKNPSTEEKSRAPSSLVAELAAEEATKGNKSIEPQCGETPPQGKLAERVREEENNMGLPAEALAKAGEDYVMKIGDRQYRVRGLEKNSSFEVLKINLRIFSGERYYLDSLDLYRAKERNHFITAASNETLLEPDLIKRDLGKLLLALETLQEKRLREALEPKTETVTIKEDDKREALELLKSPNLLKRILEDFDRCGIVGEGTNKLTGYLAAVSRKLDKPLAIIVQSTSAAGKTALMESVLAMMPEEERIKYSAMTGQSLYYLGETNLKNKILAIVEEEGAEKASYALKLLQSEGELTIASTGKDEQGRMKTEEYHVEGPVMIFLTTTAIDIDEELLNRCLVLTVDESREQTKAIHDLQREAETFEGLKRKVERDRILTIHRNAQRLLKPLHVVNPYAKQLTFLSDRTRTRRDHMKYLTLIRTITLLHQYQRPIKEADGLRYIEVTREDIASANELAHEVLGRSLDELPPQTRRLLKLLNEKIAQVCRERGMEQEDCLFTRRQVREWSGWSEFQVRTHLNKLESLEYLLPHHGSRGKSFVYELLFDGSAQTAKPQLNGLIEIAELESTIPTSSIESESSSSEKATTSPQRDGFELGSSSSSLAAESSVQAGINEIEFKAHENAQEPRILIGVVS